MLDVGGSYAYRIRGEEHAWTPHTVSNLQHAVRGNISADYAEFAAAINEQSARLLTLRGLMEFKFAPTPIPIEEVEPVSEIVKRFAHGAMSFGSSSRRAPPTPASPVPRIRAPSRSAERRGGKE